MPEIPYSVRNLHVNIVGNIGCGKSSLITWWAYNDILSNHGGVCVIDPKGDLVDELLRYIPHDRIDDCIVADINDPFPLDFISCDPGNEDDVVADLKFMLMGEMADMVQYPNINKNIENLLYSLISANTHPNLNTAAGREKRCTFLDVSEFWENKDRRDFIIEHIQDSKLRTLWREKLPNDLDREKITSRINPFVRSKALSKIFGDPAPRLDIRTVIREKKILLVRVPVDKYASATYGKLLMAKIQHAMFSVEDKRKRVPFFLYVDEFQNFPTSPNFERVIDMGRGFLLCFTLSITRLKNKNLSESMRSALDGLGSYVIFQLNPGDASFYQPHIEKGDSDLHLREKCDSAYLDWEISPPGEGQDRLFHKYAVLHEKVSRLPYPLPTIQDAINLERFEAIYKIGTAKPVRESTPTPGPKHLTDKEVSKINYIKSRSKERYSYNAPSAEFGQKRTVPNPPCNTETIPHTEVNGSTNRLSEKIEPSGARGDKTLPDE